MTGVCITNDVPDLRPCTIRGEHAQHCDGFADRWGAETNRRIKTNKECKGCLPTLAEVGLLCFSCAEKFKDGIEHAVDIITHLRSVDRAQQVDNAGVRSAAGWVIPVPNTWRTADELLVLLGHPEPGFPSDANVWEVEAITERYVDQVDVELWIALPVTAVLAVRFSAIMASALRQHPMEDYEHRVRNVRCPDCKQRSLLWKPPLMFKSEIRVECTNPTCGLVVDQTGYARLSALEQVDVKERLKVEREKIAKGKREARKAERRAVAEAREQARAAAAAEEIVDAQF